MHRINNMDWRTTELCRVRAITAFINLNRNSGLWPLRCLVCIIGRWSMQIIFR